MADGAGTRIRDPRYVERRLEVERRTDGTIILSNPTPFDRTFQTTNAALDHWAKTAPRRMWLAQRSGEGWRELAYAEGAEQVARLAASLKGLGLGPGKPLLILAQNSIEHALVAYAAMRIGAPIAPVSPQYGQPNADPSRLAHAVELIRPAALFVDDARAFAKALAQPAVAGLPVIAAHHPRPGDHPLAALLDAPAQADVARPEDIAKLMLTSGSTGRPKAVICLHANIAANGAQIAACFDDPEPWVCVHGAPWSHALGGTAILHMLLHRGGSLYIDHGQPTPARFGETIRNLKEIPTTYHNMVPAGWGFLAGELERDEGLAKVFFERVRLLQYGGAGLAQSVCDRIQAVALRTVGEQISMGTGYGSTETGPTFCNIHWPNVKTGMCGLPVPGSFAKLAPEGEKFEIRAKGPQVSPGYYNPPEGAESPFDEEGFYRLGDAAKLADFDDPRAGLVFDGRLVENFKLASGTFVAAGALRLQALSAIGGAMSDAIVCGEAQDGVGLLLFPSEPEVAALGGAEAARAAVAAGLARLNAAARGSGGRVARALILTAPADPLSGEITDKGYINQALARSRRQPEVARLFAAAPDPEVIVLD